MSHVRLRVPERGIVEVRDLLSTINQTPVAVPFDSGRVDCIAEFSRRLGRRSADYPEARALSYWMRRSELRRMSLEFEATQKVTELRRPRGTVFHIPPANVDTMFVYSWALSALLGNRNIVRLSSRTTAQGELILETLNEVMALFPAVAASNFMVEYGHDESTSRALSSECDVRVIWGGDQTVTMFRSLPIPPHATELTFPDRTSIAAISVDAYYGLDHCGRNDLASRFVNDNYVFDQMGCSSARTLVWVGRDDSTSASADFYERVTAAAEARNYDVEASTSIAKLTQAYRGAADLAATSLSNASAMLTVLRVPDVVGAIGNFCGGGFLYETQVNDLPSLAPSIGRRHQTMAVFGFEPEAVQEFVERVNGTGIDRIVPIGRALEFSRHWDGYDLVTEFTRQVTIDLGIKSHE